MLGLGFRVVGVGFLALGSEARFQSLDFRSRLLGIPQT